MTDGTIEADVNRHGEGGENLWRRKSSEQLQEEKPLEEAFAELDLLAEKLEDRDTSLEDSFRALQTGHGAFETLQREIGYSGEERCCSLMRMGHSVNFQDELAKRTKETERSDQKLSACRSGIRQNHGSGYELQYAGRRQAPSANADAGDLSGCLVVRKKLVKPFMAGMEMIHTHSLIHDDLPATG